MLSPTSINEKNNICVYIEGKKQHTQPDKPWAPPSQAHCQSFNGGSFTCTPLGLNSQDAEGSIPVNAHHPAPNRFLHTARNMPKQSAQPQVGKTLKLCKINYFEAT